MATKLSPPQGVGGASCGPSGGASWNTSPSFMEVTGETAEAKRRETFMTIGPDAIGMPMPLREAFSACSRERQRARAWCGVVRAKRDVTSESFRDGTFRGTQAVAVCRVE